MKPVLLAVMGPTGSGKTPLAEAIATELDAQRINADAFQVYRGMDIGTAKPNDRSRYLLLDIKDPNEPFGVGEYVPLAHDALGELWERGQSAIVVGGTGLYVRALFESYSNMGVAPDPVLREELNQTPLEELVRHLLTHHPEVSEGVDLKNPVRVIRAIERAKAKEFIGARPLPPFAKLKVALVPDHDHLVPRLEQRVHQMVQNGWVREVANLGEAGYGPGDPGFRAIGYRAMWDHVHGQTELDEAIATTVAETRRYSKRQRTWLRTEPGLNVLNLTGGDPIGEALELIRRELR